MVVHTPEELELLLLAEEVLTFAHARTVEERIKIKAQTENQQRKAVKNLMQNIQKNQIIQTQHACNTNSTCIDDEKTKHNP